MRYLEAADNQERLVVDEFEDLIVKLDPHHLVKGVVFDGNWKHLSKEFFGPAASQELS